MRWSVAAWMRHGSMRRSDRRGEDGRQRPARLRGSPYRARSCAALPHAGHSSGRSACRARKGLPDQRPAVCTTWMIVAARVKRRHRRSSRNTAGDVSARRLTLMPGNRPSQFEMLWRQISSFYRHGIALADLFTEPCARRHVHAFASISLSCVLVSKSLASCRSCNWLAGSPEVRLTLRPRATAGRAKSWSAQRTTWL